MSTFDATELKLSGKELVKHISDSVNSPTMFLYVPIPSKLKITKSQYKSMVSEDCFDDMVMYHELTGELKPSEDAKMFRTYEDPITRKGGYVLETEIVEDKQ